MVEWVDDAVVLGVRKHGETSVIAELMTFERGRCMGLVQGGRSRTMRRFTAIVCKSDFGRE